MTAREQDNMRLSEPTLAEYRSDREYLICWEVWRRCMYAMGRPVTIRPEHAVVLARYRATDGA